MSAERVGGTGEVKHLPRPHPELAWQPDLIAAFGLASAVGRLDNFQPVEPDPGVEFIEAPGVTAHIISGGRGTGKSTLLYYRTRRLRRHGGDDLHFVREVPPHGFYLPPLSVGVPAAALPSFANTEIWCATWRVVLGLIFAFMIKRQTTPRQSVLRLEDWNGIFGVGDEDLLRKMVQRVHRWSNNPHSDCVEDLLSTVVQACPTTAFLDALYRDKIKPVQEGLSFTGTWVLVVDRIDEALADHQHTGALLAPNLRESYVDDDRVTKENVADYVHHLWRCAQAAFAIVAYQFRAASNGQLTVLGTIRAETYATFVANSGLPHSKTEFFMLRLEPDEPVLRAIFRLNVDLMNDRCRAPTSFSSRDPDAGADTGLMGCQSLFSRSVFGFKETPYEYLRRHTFQTPRSLVTLGREVARIKAVPRPGLEGATWRPPELVMECVSRTSVDVFKEYVETLFPSWDSDYEKGFALINHDVMSYVEIHGRDGIEDRFKVLCPDKPIELIEYLHSCGLVGVPARAPSGEWRQAFKLRGHDAPILPPDFAYALLHPAFTAYLKHKFPGGAAANFENNRLVPSPGGPCPERLRDVALRLRFQRTDNSAVVRCDEFRAKNEAELFSSVGTVGQALLVVLAVAHCRYGAGHLGKDELRDVAVRLARLGFIPERLGKAERQQNGGSALGRQEGRRSPPATAKKPSDTKAMLTGKSPEDWIRNICERSAGESEKGAVTDAKKLLKTGWGLTIDVKNNGVADRMCLYWEAAPLPRPMERDEIGIEGLSIGPFLKANPHDVPP